jgi:hypothetical protein
MTDAAAFFIQPEPLNEVLGQAPTFWNSLAHSLQELDKAKEMHRKELAAVSRDGLAQQSGNGVRQFFENFPTSPMRPEAVNSQRAFFVESRYRRNAGNIKQKSTASR